MSITLIELTGAVDAAGTLQKFYLSTDSFVTTPSDTPASVAFISCLTDPCSIGITAYSDGKTGGATKLETGEIVISNVDGSFDSWLNYSFDGRPVTIRSGTTGAYPSAFTTLFTGTIDSIELSWKKLIIRLRDKQFIFDLPAQTNLYGGTNSLPNGLDGVATDLQGKTKPLTYGTVYNISPPMVNTSTLTFQVNDGIITDIPAVYSSGAPLTKGADYANSTLMQAATITAGYYITCFAEGFFRVNFTLDGIITADVVQGATTANRTVAQILKSLGLKAGLSAGEISSGDVTALDSLNSSVVGIYVADASTYKTVMDEVAASVGAWYGFDSTGTMRMGVISVASGAPVASLYSYDVGDAVERMPAQDHNIPVWRFTLSYTKYYTVQTTNLAGSVTAARRGVLANQYRTTASADSSVKTQYLLALDIADNTLLTSSSDAATEAARRLALYKVHRDMFSVPVDISIVVNSGLKIMDVVSLTLNRFGLNAGKSLRVIGIRFELTTNRAILTLWG